MSDIGITARNISLDFQLRKPSFFDLIKQSDLKGIDSKFRAVNNVSFEIVAGDRVGIIGKNGAGKSTLLKLIAGVLNPSEGQLSLKGNVFPLLDLSADIVQQATCLQNIRLSGYLKGLKGQPLDQYIESVIESADVNPFLYSPVSALSTGMKTRFLVSLIGDVEPEILIMDEWIGTADKSFTNQKTSRLNGLVESSDIFILATHNRNLLRGFCNKIMLIDQGRLSFFGDVLDGYKRFNELLAK
jgi:ABC-type polysaccharide/polyol phosphate transport system ATPase subunit